MRWVRLLLHLYPAAFRAEYGEELCAVLAQRRRDAPGVSGRMLLWLEIVPDTLWNAAAAHWDILRQDLKYAGRALARSPGFALTVIAVTALGVGANTAAFSLADHVLVRPLPFPDPSRLVTLYQTETTHGYRYEASPANYRDWKRMSGCFRDMAAYRTISVNLVGTGDPERLDGASVNWNLFPLLGVQPFLGRSFAASDDREGAPGIVLLSYGLWNSLFGADRSVLGRKVILDGEAFTIAGVMPRDFHFPTREAELWTPMRFVPDDFADRTNTYLHVVARLASGVTPQQASAQMDLVAASLERAYPKDNTHIGVLVRRLRDEVSSQARLLLAALSAAAVCVLLIACTNLANLLIARALARRKELAVRAALGAGRERLMRQMLTESILLGLLGGSLGVGIAMAAVPLLVRLVPNSLPIAEVPSTDWRVLAFAAIVTAVTVIAFGVLPAVRATGDTGLDGLREGSRSGIGGRRAGLRSALVVAEITISVVLLVSSGLLLRALWRLQSTDPGFRADGVLTLQTSLPMPKYEKTARRAQFYSRVLSPIRELPGVSAAAYISFLPMTMRGGIWSVILPGQTMADADRPKASLRFVTPGFFAALGIPVLRGRDIAESDTSKAPFAAVVSESFARRFLPDRSPLGRHFEISFFDRTIVGVVGDIRVRGLERESEPQVYLSYQQVPDGYTPWYAPKDLVIRSAGDPEKLLPAVRRAIRAADPQQPVSDVRTLADIVDGETEARRLQVRVLTGFTLIAVLLAGLGIHGVLAFSVSQRAPEIGVRIALGAQRSDILGMVMKDAFALALAGMAVGAALAYAAGRALESLLAGVKPDDAPTFLAAAALGALMTLAGCLVPALRALRVDPITAVRSE